jgi:hypothetical protein
MQQESGTNLMYLQLKKFINVVVSSQTLAYSVSLG